MFTFLKFGTIFFFFFLALQSKMGKRTKEDSTGNASKSYSCLVLIEKWLQRDNNYLSTKLKSYDLLVISYAPIIT